MNSCIFMTLSVIMVFLAACTTFPNEVSLYQDHNNLIIESQDEVSVLLTDVVDYSYNRQSSLLFVLHEERSSHTDMIGYKTALEEGLVVGGYIRVYEILWSSNPITLDEIYENDFTWVNPWSLASGTLSADGGVDLFVACYRATEFYEADRRPFIVTWDGEKIIKRWTGSYIGNDGFLMGDFGDVDEDGIDELVLTVRREDTHIVKRYYSWQTFSFNYLYETIID